MDTVTQAVLGASIAYVTVGGKLGRRSLLVGAALATLPDLDVLVPHADAVDTFTLHRSWSHSLFVLTLASPLLALLLTRLFSSSEITFKQMCLMVWLVLFTHPLLDSFTIYGTQIGWPLNNYPVGLGTIFIIDPLYTLPMLVVCVALLFKRTRASDPRASLINNKPFRFHRKTALFALLASTLYLLLTLVLHQHVTRIAKSSLADQNINFDRVFVAPAPGSLLWRIVAMDESHYHEGFYSLLDGDRPVPFQQFASGQQWLTALEQNPQSQRLRWFSKGFIAAAVENEEVILSDLRMGVEAQYVFRFVVAESKGDTITPVYPTRLLRFQPDLDRVSKLIRRTTNPDIDVRL